ncbi:MAG: hypothetical protein ABIH23_36135 [bacterium]
MIKDTFSDWLLCCVLLLALSAMPTLGQPSSTAILLKPLAPPAKGEFGELGFTISVSWMEGTLQMRFPETVHSRKGLQFIDHFRADMPPISMLDPVPNWTKDEGTGAVSYSCVTNEGVAFGGRTWPEEEKVEMEFFVENRSDEDLEGIALQMCLVLTDTKAFGKKEDLSDTYTWIDGVFTSLSKTTPTPVEKGRRPWILILTRKEAMNYSGATEYPDGWWVVAQGADHDIIARTSADKRHIVAITWDDSPAFLMTNTAIPCLHAGPTRPVTLKPGEKNIRRGRVYLMANTPDELLKRYTQDRTEKTESSAN